MGEFLSFMGRCDEAEGWIRKAIRLNPYHPPRYWSHLARALFHMGRFQEALDALANVSAPRVRDLAYAAAASHALGGADASATHVKALRAAKPDFEAVRFVEALPYVDGDDPRTLLDQLNRALA